MQTHIEARLEARQNKKIAVTVAIHYNKNSNAQRRIREAAAWEKGLSRLAAFTVLPRQDCILICMIFMMHRY